MTTHTRIIKRASLVNQKIAIEEAIASERERCVKALEKRLQFLSTSKEHIILDTEARGWRWATKFIKELK